MESEFAQMEEEEEEGTRAFGQESTRLAWDGWLGQRWENVFLLVVLWIVCLGLMERGYLPCPWMYGLEVHTYRTYRFGFPCGHE